MKLTKELERSGLLCDTKARRRLNVTSAKANITAEAIECGVSIEELREIGVPVFRYETQVTIHGHLPDVSSGRVNGYKSLVKNGNGSVGVKYSAIDGEKKKLISNACKALGSKFSGHFNSKGFSLFLRTNTREEVLEAYHSFPSDLVYGSIYAGALQFGGFGLFVEVGSVDQSNMNNLLLFLTGKGIESCLDAINDFQAKEEEKQRLYEIEWKERSEKLARERKEVTAKLLELLKGLAPVAEFHAGKYKIASGVSEGGEVIWKEFEFAKRGAFFCYKGKNQAKFAKYTGQLDKALSKFAFKIGVKAEPKAKPIRNAEKNTKAKHEADKGNEGLKGELMKCIEWQAPDIYITKKGKAKGRVCGIPLPGFWLLWKHSKEDIKALGVTIFAGKAEGTGQYKTVKGRSFEIKRKQWEVTLWKPELLGFSSPKIEIDCPF